MLIWLFPSEKFVSAAPVPVKFTTTPEVLDTDAAEAREAIWVIVCGYSTASELAVAVTAESVELTVNFLYVEAEVILALADNKSKKSSWKPRRRLVISL